MDESVSFDSGVLGDKTGIEGGQTPFEELASIAALRGLSNEEYIDELQEFKIIPQWNALQASALAFTLGIMPYPTGSGAFLEQKSTLIGSQAGEGILKLVRRASQQYTTIAEISSDEDIFIWITEHDDRDHQS